MAQPIVRLRRGIDRVLAPPTGALRGVLRLPMVRAVLIALLLIILFGFPIVDKDPLSQSIDTASAAEVFVLLALGLNVVVGFAGLLDLGYAAFFAIGAYTMALLASSHFTIIGHSASNPFFNFGPGGIHVNFFLMIPVAALAAALCGVIFGAPTLRL
ncbi:MAG: ABC transporter ATP-binding protein, partial [Chloroflexota bacterium]|nr:ABC transporter ATP-binding protein [Chloroflexota bacterium]